MTTAQATKDVTQEVLSAAARLVQAFADHDVQRYFDGFAEDASFMFHNTERILTSRAAYEQKWREWETDGFRVRDCRSVVPRVQIVSVDCAVFTHRVTTTLAGADEVQHERETIVFRRIDGGRWVAVHEHLSVDPLLDEDGHS